MKNIKKMEDEVKTLKDMIEYSLNDPNQTEEVIKRNVNLMKRLARLQRKLNEM